VPTVARPHHIYDPHDIVRPLASAPAPVSIDSVNVDPFTGAQLAQFSALIANPDQPPRFLVTIYKAAAKRYHLPWQILAAINAIETGYGRDLSVSPAGAIGWMQFMPGTWKEYGLATDGSHAPNPYDPRDAIFTAARYLAANDGSRDLRRALFAYNHALWYVDAVLWRAQMITDLGLGKGVPKSGYALPLDSRYMHQLGRTDDGLDIEDAPDGAAVYSITPGVVTAVASDPAGFGPNYPVILATEGPLAGQYIYYGHVAASMIHVGQHVRAGQPIAVMGHTGDAASLGHGHIEIGFSDASGDPLNHHGAAAWTPSGDAMRHVIIGLAAAFHIEPS
jgi:murein DD-endopeptidase MepM/ murein hydrolase activator NlpD